MTREYTHDDVCRGAADGCDCDTALCEGCGRQVRKDELDSDLKWCGECQEEFESETDEA